VQRACGICQTTFETKRPSALYCSPACRQRAHRTGVAKPATTVKAGGGLAVVPDAPDASDVPVQPPVGGELVVSTEKALRDAGRLETWQGQAALELARRIDMSSRVETGSAYASLHRELRAAMLEATRGANVAKSAVQQRRDDLAARRAARHG
jgi:hypothetical protein